MVGGWGRVCDDQFLTFDVESKSAKIPKFHYSWGGGGVSNNRFPTFDTEYKSAKIPKSHYSEGRWRGWWQPTFKSQLQTFKPKSQAEISISGGGRGWWQVECMEFGATT